MTIDDDGSTPAPGGEPADKAELQRRVEEMTESVRSEAAADPGPEAAPVKKAARKRAPAKKATPTAAPAATDGAASGDPSSDAAAAATAPGRKTAKRAAKKAAPGQAAAGAGAGDPATTPRKSARKAAAKKATATPVVAPAPVAEPGNPTAPSAPQPEPPSRGPAQPVQTRTVPPGTAGAEPALAEPALVEPALVDPTPGSGAPSASGEPVTTQGREVGEDELRAVVEGWSYNPHGVLGAHRLPEGWAVRTLRPDALAVTVVDQDGSRYECTQVHDGGVYEARLPHQPGDYRLDVLYDNGAGGQDSYTVDDPYRWLPTLGELDQHLIREGRHEQLWTVLGAHVRGFDTPGGRVEGVSFAVWAPNARGVKVTGDFDYWQARAYPMRSLGSSGVWEVYIPGVQVGAKYRFHVLGADGQWRAKSDPMAFATEVPPANASVVSTSTHVWGDEEWLAQRAEGNWHRRPMSVYEVHAGSWRQGLSYRDMAEELVGYAVDAGFTHLEFMPLAEHPFGGSWGYQVTSYYAPTSRFGSPDDLRYLIDRAHQAGLGVLVDWVPAHFPKDDWALGRFDGTPLYEHGDPRRGEQPDWGTYVFDFGRSEVRNFLVANALYWAKEFHVDGIRVDAVASMLYLDYSRNDGEWSPNVHGGRENLEAVAFLQEMNATLYREVPGITTIAEESTAWPGVTRPTYLGGLGFGFKWNMGWMHDSLAYVSKQPVHRSYHHNQLTFSLVYAYSENYVLPISHDEVVYGKGSLVRKMPGDRWQQLANLRAFLGYMWAHPGKQLLFMGSEFGQLSEWAESRSLDWWHLEDPAHAGVLRLVRDLNTVYKDTEALYSQDSDPAGFQWIDANDAPGNTLSFLRYGADGQVLACVANFAGTPHHEYRLGLPRGGRWREVVNTDFEGYGGSGVGNYGGVDAVAESWHGQPYSATLSAPPLGTVWFVHEGPEPDEPSAELAAAELSGDLEGQDISGA